MCLGVNSKSKGKNTLLSSHDLFPLKTKILPDYFGKYYIHSTLLVFFFFHLRKN